jgi:hypothetical protein
MNIIKKSVPNLTQFEGELVRFDEIRLVIILWLSNNLLNKILLKSLLQLAVGTKKEH